MSMRDLIRIVEGSVAQAATDFYLHVTSLRNRASVLRHGLLPNHGQGNYAGYWQSLEGVYVTREPSLVGQHIDARGMGDSYLLVVVEVAPGHGLIDEDALHDCLDTATKAIMQKQGRPIEAVAASRTTASSRIWSGVVPALTTMLGKPDPAALARHPGLLREFVHSWITEHIYGEEVDPLWWADAKEALVACFPAMSGPGRAARHSLRLPGPLTYVGSPRIVAVVQVLHGAASVIKGRVPGAAQSLVAAVTSEGDSPDMAGVRRDLVIQAIKAHPRMTASEVQDAVDKLADHTAREYLRNYLERNR